MSRRFRFFVFVVMFAMLAASSGCSSSDSPTAPTPPQTPPQIPTEPVESLLTVFNVVSGLDNSPVSSGEVVYKEGAVQISGGRAELKNLSRLDELTIRANGYMERNTLYCGDGTFTLLPNAGQGGVDEGVLSAITFGHGVLAGGMILHASVLALVPSEEIWNDPGGVLPFVQIVQPPALEVLRQAATRVEAVTRGRTRVYVTRTPLPGEARVDIHVDPGPGTATGGPTNWDMVGSDLGRILSGRITYIKASDARSLSIGIHEITHVLGVYHYPYDDGMMSGLQHDGSSTSRNDSLQYHPAEQNAIDLKYLRRSGTVWQGPFSSRPSDPVLPDYDRHLGCP